MRGELGARVCLAAERIGALWVQPQPVFVSKVHSLLPYAIVDVVLMGTNKQVRWVYAARRVAVVANDQAIGDALALQFIR
jgi:hypothetical protein